MLKKTKSEIRAYMCRINTIDDIERELDKNRSYFFSRETMRFFASRKLEGIFKLDKRGGEQRILFLTSEKKCFNDRTRVYAVNVFDPNKIRVETHRRQTFNTADQARSYGLRCEQAQAISEV